MRIAVNARFLLHEKLEGVGIVTDEVMKRMVQQHPEDQFDYYLDRKVHPRFVHGANVYPHVLAPVTRLPILLRYWLNQPVRNNVKKQKADVFFSPDGFVPLGMSTPKVAMVHDIAYLRHPEYLQPRIRRFYDKWMPRYLAYTDHIITVSEFSKQELIAGYHIPAEKISVVYNGVTASYKPLAEDQRQLIRNQYTGGKPYFLYLGAIHPRKNILTLIKAFDHYKKNQATDVQLVLAGRNAWHTQDVLKSIQASPFKNEIHLPGYIPTDHATALVASAAAMIYPSFYEGFGLPLVEAMACGVPVITSNASSLPEVADDAALLFDPMDFEKLAQHMHTLNADQSVVEDLIQKGFKRIQFFSWDKAADQIYSILKKFGNPKAI